LTRNILSQENRALLKRFARSNVILAFDYDGTLSPIVSDPIRATMRPTTRRLLGQLAGCCPCVVISGRARADIEKHLRTIRVHGIVGNHGVEPWQATDRLERRVRRWLAILQTRLGSLHGVKTENKTYSIAIHYRQARQKGKTLAMILRASALLGAARVMGGKQAVNILPRGAPNKGTALERERMRLGCDTAIYVGDDDTDEDAFQAGPPSRLLAIRIGAKAHTSAAFFLRRQTDIDRFLRALLSVRIATANERAPARRAAKRP
jgi:trehalose 6-phosphate phosphatase